MSLLKSHETVQEKLVTFKRQIATAPIRKGIKSPIKKIGHKLRTWYGDDPWNKIDLAFELFFFSAFILKNIVWYYSNDSDHFDEAHREIKVTSQSQSQDHFQFRWLTNVKGLCKYNKSTTRHLHF